MSSFRKKGKQVLSTIIENTSAVYDIENGIYNIIKDYDNELNMEILYNNYIYQIVGDIINGKHINCIVDNIKTKKNGWDHPTFFKYKEQLNEKDEFIENPFEIEEGVLECKCGSKKVFSYSKQLRSCDEPSTTFATCCMCNAKWTYNG